MTKEQLIESARQLATPHNKALIEFQSRQDLIAAELNRIMLARPDLEKLIGANNQSMMENNSRNMLRFMTSLFEAYQPVVLAETALWVFRAYRAHGFHTSYWPANLDTTVQILKEKLSPNTFIQIYPFFNWLIVNIPTFVQISDTMLQEGPAPDGHT